MFTRFKVLWAVVRDSLWFIPTLFTLLAMGMALVMIRIDHQFEKSVSEVDHWFLSGGAEGARLVLSTIAGSLITVTGVVFSVTIVGLQLASTQFTPRILRNFLADRSNQIVLGVFISTFTYTLLVLRVVRSKLENNSEFVPHLSVALAIVMALVSVAFLIHFIHHAARSIQASVILSRVTHEGLKRVRRLFPEEIAEAESAENVDAKVPRRDSKRITAAHSGYLQAVNAQALFELGEEHELLIRMNEPVGAFIVKGQAYAEVLMDEKCTDEVCAQIRNAFVIGEERTPDQDVEFCIIEITDIAVKALSPGINDPTTALHSIDRLVQILCALGRRRPPAPLRTSDGSVHFLAMPTTFERALELAFNPILHFGKDNPAIVERLRSAIELMQTLLPSQRQAALRTYLARIEDQGSKSN
jgi:uncharacterized membrane protein